MQKRKQLKDQFTLRIYSQQDKNILDKAYARNKSGFIVSLTLLNIAQ